MSGEWTAKTVEKLCGAESDTVARRVLIANAHNAALAEQKRDLWDKISLARMEADNWKGLYENERDKYERSQEKVRRYFDLLAAERIAKDRLLTQVADMTEQLDAERQKVRKLEKELEKDKGVLDFIREQRRKAESGELGPEYQLK